MYQNCCKKCGSTDLFLEEKGSNTGLYCSDCGAWIKWVSKEEKRAYEHSKKANIKESDSVKYVSSYDTDPSYAILESLPDHMTRAEIIRIITTYGMQDDVSCREFQKINDFTSTLEEFEEV